ncbi:MAG TPA: hypothetical protein VHU81_11820 [Thermoanaerobaculia bacterium]|jgi:hypothetical protein|nr:hypothetical protein [Thermoanaerobaculia bacterium]
MDLDFYWDEAGDPRARGKGRAGTRFAAFLESDIQGSDAYAREVLEAIERVAAGELDGWETTGNAHTLSVQRSGATLVSEYEEEEDGEEPTRLSLAAVRKALQGWIEMLGAGGPGAR